MTVIDLSAELLALGGTSPVARGTVQATAINSVRQRIVRVIGRKIVFAPVISVEIANGELTSALELEPSEPGEWCWKFVIHDRVSAQSLLAYKEVPDSPTPVAFGDLEDVDLSTLTPVTEPGGPTWREVVAQQVVSAYWNEEAELVLVHQDGSETVVPAP